MPSKPTTDSLEVTAPMLFSVLRNIGSCRARWSSVLGSSAATIEVWFTPLAWRDFLGQLADHLPYGGISMGGEPYGAMCGGAECFCHSDVLPVNVPFQLRLRID